MVVYQLFLKLFILHLLQTLNIFHLLQADLIKIPWWDFAEFYAINGPFISAQDRKVVNFVFFFKWIVTCFKNLILDWMCLKMFWKIM